MKVKNSINFKHEEVREAFNSQPSMTIPDQTMSMREILTRYAQGMPIAGNIKTPIYEGSDYLPDPRTLDLSERQELAERYELELSEIKTKATRKKTSKPATEEVNPIAD